MSERPVPPASTLSRPFSSESTEPLAVGPIAVELHPLSGGVRVGLWDGLRVTPVIVGAVVARTGPHKSPRSVALLSNWTFPEDNA